MRFTKSAFQAEKKRQANEPTGTHPLRLATGSVSKMRATKFEFEQRFWIIGLIFSIGFGLSSVDHVYFATGLLHLLRPDIAPDTEHGVFLQRLIFGAGAVLLFLAALLRTWATAYLRSEIVHDAAQHSEALL